MPRSRSVVLAAVSASVLAMATGVASAATAPAAVRHASATTRSSTQVVLSWTNPSTPSFAATVVRMAQGSKAPAGPTQGRRVATVRKSHDSLIVGKLTAGKRYAFALFASDGHGDFAPRVVVRAMTAPAAVTNVEAFAAATAISLQWTNPKTKSFARVVARYAKGHKAPARPDGGRPLHLGSAKATTATLAHLAKDTTYSVSIWARDHKNRTSTRSYLSFTTDAAPTANGVYVGRIVDTDGAPLDHIDVEVNNYNDGGRFTTTTGSDGRFTLALPTSAEYFVDIEGGRATGGNSDATGYRGADAEIDVSPGRTTNGGSVTLQPGGAVTGRVTDSAGHPLAGVAPYVAPITPYVDVTDSGFAFFYDLGSQPPVLTAADGTFTIKGLPTNALSICYNPASGPVTGGTADGYAAQCDPTTVAVAPKTTTAHGDTQLVAAAVGAIAGRVTNAAGTGLGNALVEITSRTKEDESAVVTTGADGRYLAAGLAAGAYQVCVDATNIRNGSRTGYRTSCRAHLIPVAAAHQVTVNVALREGAAVTGKVVGPTGQPLAGVQVQVEHPTKNESGASGYAVTDSRGHYVVKGLVATTYRACFDGSAATGPGDPTGALAACSPGRFAVKTGAVRTGIDARLKMAGAIAGTVTAANGKPVENAEVEVDAGNDPFGERGGFAQTDTRGRYTVRGLPAGSYRVCFETLDLTSSQTEKCEPGKVAVRIGHTRRDVDAVLATGSSITVSVHDPNGQPIAGVDAAVMSPCGGGDDDDDCTTEPVFSATKGIDVVASWITDGNGTVTFDGLRAGHYVVCLFAFYGATTVGNSPTGYVDACSGTAFSITVTKNHTTKVSKVLAPAGVVTGRVTDSSGHPLRGVRVHVTHSAGDNYEDDFEEIFADDPTGPAAYSVTDRNGRYSVRSVAPGSQTVCMSASNAAGGTSTGGYLDQCVGGQPNSKHGATIGVTAGATTSDVNLALTSAAAISGTVTASGRLVQEPQVMVINANGDTIGYANAGSGGRYKVDRLPPGAKTVCFWAPQYAGQCYKGVAWNEGGVPAKATRITTTPGATRTGIDAVLHKS